MTIQLYGIGSSRSFRCMWALEEAGLDYQFHKINVGSQDPHGGQHPDYLKINPQGKVPTMIDGDFRLTESAAIVNYIAAKANPTLIPNGLEARARYDELSYYVLSDLEQPLWNNGKHRFVLPEEQRIKAMLNTANWEFQRSVKGLQELFPFEQYVLNETFSMADILLAHTFEWAQGFRFEVPQKYLDYRDAMYARQAAKKALAVLEENG